MSYNIKALFTENQWKFAIGFAYFIISFSLPFLNKYVLMKFNYPVISLGLFIQNLLTILIYHKNHGRGGINRLKTVIFDAKFFPIALCNIISVMLALYALKVMNIAVLDVIKRCGPMINFVLRVLILRDLSFFKSKNGEKKFEMLGVILTVLGACISSTNDSTHPTKIYIISIISVVLLSCYQTFIEKSGVKQNLSTTEIIYKLGWISIIFLPFLGFAFEHSEILQLIGEFTTKNNEETNINNYSKIVEFLFYLILQAFGGILLNLIMFECSIINSALLTSMIGLSKSTLTSIFGLFSFGGFVYTSKFLTGLGINIVGSAVFVVSKALSK